MNGYNLTGNQKELLCRLVRYVREGRLNDPILLTYTTNGYRIEARGEEPIRMLGTGDLDALCDANLMSFTPGKRKNRHYSIRQAGYDAVDCNFQQTEDTGQSSSEIKLGDIKGGIRGSVIAGRDVVLNIPIPEPTPVNKSQVWKTITVGSIITVILAIIGLVADILGIRSALFPPSTLTPTTVFIEFPLEQSQPTPTTTTTALPPDIMPTPTPTSTLQSSLTEEEQQVNAVIETELKSAIDQDLLLLEKLYAPNAIVVDAKGTTDNAEDDDVYIGWENIEKRYLKFFLCCDWHSMSVVDLDVKVNGNKATGIHKGIIVDGKYYQHAAVYTLEKIDNEWLITSLKFGYRQ